MPSFTTFDTSELYTWSEITSYVDLDGFLVGQTTTFDDGRVRATTISDGVVTNAETSDPLNVAPWTTVTTLYSDITGLKTSQTRIMDDGRSITTTFVDGVTAARSFVDVGNEYNWASKALAFDAAGRLASVTVTYDNGRTAETDFVDGVRSQRTISDLGNTENWATKVYNWNVVTGELLTITTTYDDSTVVVSGPKLGPLGQTVTAFDTADIYTWDSRTSLYDATGVLDQRTFEYDDGRIKVTDFTDGVRSQINWTDADDVMAWSTHQLDYGVNGQLNSRQLTYDDGRESTATYIDGVLASKTVEDVSNAYSWGTQVSTFDANGLIATRLVTRDDGITIESIYADGVVQSQLLTDVLNAAVWNTIEKVYDTVNGALIYVETTLDDGTKTFEDIRGLEIVTGGTQATVTEDAAITLTATGTIDIVDAYKGSSDFVAQTSVMGDSGLGSFTLLADGTWTYEAINDQVAIQGLNLGETLTDSFTAVTSDGVETTVTVTIEGDVYSAAPVYAGETLVTVGAAGNLATASAGYQLFNAFTSDDGHNLILGFGATTSFDFLDFFNIFSVSTTGGITVADIANIGLGGDYGIEFFAVDNVTNDSTSVNVTLAIALEHDFTNDFIGTTPREQFGSSIDDTIVYNSSGPLSFAQDLTFSLLAGDDTATFGDKIAEGSGVVNVDLGTGDDVVVFGDFAALFGGQVFVDGGADNDSITFGQSAASTGGFVSIDGGLGDDIIQLGANAGTTFGAVNVIGGLGADQITLGAAATNVSIFLGSDTDADTLTFEGDVYSATIYNWVQGTDSIIFENATGVWGAQDVAGDLVFISSNRDGFTVVGAAGVDAGDVVSGLTYSVAPTFVGNAALANGVVGSAGAAYSQDLNGLFSDADVGDTVTLTTNTTLPNGITFTNGVLSALNSVSLGGDYTITVTATDSVEMSIDQDVTFSLALDHDFGGNYGIFYGSETVTGSSLSDTMIFGNGMQEGADVIVNSGAGVDVITFGTGAGTDGFGSASLAINAGTGADTITIGAGAFGVAIDLGVDIDADTLSFLGTVSGVTIANWTQGDDSITFASQSGNIWTVADVSGDAVFSTNGQSFTVIGAAGIAAADLVAGLEMNVAPTFIGASTMLESAAVGSLAPVSVYSQDLNTLFGDANAPSGDTFTISATGLGSNFTLTNGVLTLTNPASLSAVGDHTIAVTATDLFGASVTQDVTVAVAHHHDYGTFTSAGVTTYVSGSSLADTFTFGDNAGAMNGSVTASGGAGDDIITFGNDAGSDNGDVDVLGSSGNDAVTFGDNAGSDGGSVYISTGSDVDTIMIGDNAAQNGGLVLISAGLGDDAITFGSIAGTVAIYAGLGADTITFDGNVTGGSNSGVALGNPSSDHNLPYGDLAADTLIFNGTVADFVIFNFETGFDSVDVLNEGAWSITSDDGTNTALSDGVSDLTFMNITGLTDVADFLI